jgi:peptide/nickel transport system permease protein
MEQKTPSDQNPGQGANATSAQSRLKKYRPLASYLAKRIGVYLFTLWASLSLAFVMFRFMPGNPLAMSAQQITSNGTLIQGAAQAAEFYKDKMGLNDPLYIQYFKFLKNMVTGPLDFGPSFVKFPMPVNQVIPRYLPWTLGLFTTSVLFSWALGTAIGAILGWLRHSRFSAWAVVLTTFLNIVPIYILAIFLLLLFSYRLDLLPKGLPYDAQLMPGWNWEFISSVLTHAILPVFTMVLVWSSGWILAMRALMISVLGEDYLAYARAKGLSPMTVLREYAFRNALLPQVAGLAIVLGMSLNGAYIIEAIFRVPGLGYLFASAAALRDFNTMMGLLVFSAFTVLTGSLIVDLAMPLFDPRIRRTNA